MLNWTKTFSMSFSALYHKLLLHRLFLTVVYKAIRKFSHQIRVNPPLIHPFIEFSTTNFTLQVRRSQLLLSDETR